MTQSNRLLLGAAALGSLLLIAPIVTQARTKPIYNPEPIQVPCALGTDKLRSAVRTGVLDRGWIPKETSAGVMEARLDKRDHVAIVTIRYDAKSVTIRYKSSENLNYSGKGDTAEIHPNYNNWIKNIEKDIALRLSRACG